MNDDRTPARPTPSPSPSASPDTDEPDLDSPTLPPRASSEGHHNDADETSDPPSATDRGGDGGKAVREQRKETHRAGLAKKLRFMTSLLKNLDALVYAELSALYYMECSFFRFSIRSFAQFTFLTPKSETFPLILPAARTHVLSIFLPNAICILLHLFAALPTASEESRGYLHGGIMVDFIGQKAPTSRFSLLAFDAAIIILQCLMLAVHSQREQLRGALRGPALQRRPDDDGSRSNEDAQDGALPTSARQDLDAEERGVLRDLGDADDDINVLRGLLADEPSEGERGSGGAGASTSRRDTDLNGLALQSTEARTELLDVMNSGNGVLGEYHILHTLRTATTDYDTAAAHSIQTLGYTAAVAALIARRRAETAAVVAAR